MSIIQHCNGTFDQLVYTIIYNVSIIFNVQFKNKLDSEINYNIIMANLFFLKKKLKMKNWWKMG